MSSATMKLRHLNDFTTPSTICWKGSSKPNPTEPPDNSKVFNDLNKGSSKDLTRRKAGADDAEMIKLSLNDCLTCSGCVSPEETTMLQSLSLDDFLLNINKGKDVIVSISPQSMASFAAHFSVSPLQALAKLTTFFKALGVKAVFDTSCGRDMALKEACNEFVERYKQSQSTGGNASFPMISSACPGWIDHAEKNLGSNKFPYISSVKSPQQMMGTIIKRYQCQKMLMRPDEVYHVTVMPCYEKKLEAVRDDFMFNFDYQDGDHINGDVMVREVDSVLTSAEVLELMQSKSVDFTTLEESLVDRMLTHVSDDGRLYGVNGSSGGYAETVFRHAAKSLFGRNLEGPLDFKILKTDLYEVCLEVEGRTLLKFALCYGRRNLRTITQNIKSGKCNYHFVEIMTCPSGCLNGGGQIERKAGQSLDDFMQLVKNAYMENVLVADPLQNPVVSCLYDEWLGEPGSKKAKQYMHTGYHPVGPHPVYDW